MNFLLTQYLTWRRTFVRLFKTHPKNFWTPKNSAKNWSVDSMQHVIERVCRFAFPRLGRSARLITNRGYSPEVGCPRVKRAVVRLIAVPDSRLAAADSIGPGLTQAALFLTPVPVLNLRTENNPGPLRNRPPARPETMSLSSVSRSVRLTCRKWRLGCSCPFVRH